jgi:cation diffusion facilitator family transporter
MMLERSSDSTRRGVRAAQLGLLANTFLAITKLVAGLVGHSYALVADAVESSADVLASLVVWGGLRVAGRDPDEAYPFGYGKAEPLAAAVVSLMLLGAAVAISVQSIDEIRTPHTAPASWTLAVLVGVLLVKGLLSRRSERIGVALESTAVRADARHHLSDALTSAAAFVGISVALVGGPGWEAADDWAALAASGVIAWNGWAMLRPALDELMDRTPGPDLVALVESAALSVPGVLAVEKVAVRKAGMVYRVTLHVQTAPRTPLDEAHRLGGRVKGAIGAALPQVQSVLVHLEPYEGEPFEGEPSDGGPGGAAHG